MQVYDDAFTYYLLTLGVADPNPLVDDAIQMRGAAWGLIYWTVLACVLIALIFALRPRRCALARALTLTAAVYGCLALIGFLAVILAVGI